MTSDLATRASVGARSLLTIHLNGKIDGQSSISKSHSFPFDATNRHELRRNCYIYITDWVYIMPLGKLHQLSKYPILELSTHHMLVSVSPMKLSLFVDVAAQGDCRGASLVL